VVSICAERAGASGVYSFCKSPASNRIATKTKSDLLEGKEFPYRRKTIKLSELIPTYVAWAEKTNRSSKLKDKRVLDEFLDSIGDRRLGEVKSFDIERWKTAKGKDVEKSTVNRELNVIRSFFSRAVEWGKLRESPVTAVKPYRVDNVRTRILSHEEIRKVLDYERAEGRVG
jgi:site-specific recombinase XerD